MPKFRFRAPFAFVIPLETSTEATVDDLHSLFLERKGEAKVLFDVERAGRFHGGDGSGRL